MAGLEGVLDTHRGAGDHLRWKAGLMTWSKAVWIWTLSTLPKSALVTDITRAPTTLSILEPGPIASHGGRPTSRLLRLR